jgi:hypothetical protein
MKQGKIIAWHPLDVLPDWIGPSVAHGALILKMEKPRQFAVALSSIRDPG